MLVGNGIRFMTSPPPTAQVVALPNYALRQFAQVVVVKPRVMRQSSRSPMLGPGVTAAPWVREDNKSCVPVFKAPAVHASLILLMRLIPDGPGEPAVQGAAPLPVVGYGLADQQFDANRLELDTLEQGLYTRRAERRGELLHHSVCGSRPAA